MAAAVDDRAWHVARARAILLEHPEVRALEGPLPVTAALILLLVGIQTAAALAAAGLSWPWLALAAWGFGAFPALGLFVLLHEGSHGLIFVSPLANRWAMTVATAPLLLPWAPGFAHFHLEHHRALGDPYRDVDRPAPWELGLIAAGPLTRLGWLTAWPIVQLVRLGACRPHRMWGRWFATNLLTNLAYLIALGSLGGAKPVAYCALSLAFGFGCHPLGGRLLQEHVARPPNQPSASYYGPANRVLFNAGYHVEHHDFMRVAWARLPRLRRIAASHYGALVHHLSWTVLAVGFVTRGATAAPR